MSYSGGESLSLLAEPLNCGGDVDCSDYALVLLPSFKWERVGNVSIAGDNSSVTLQPLGQDAVTLQLTRPGSDIAIPATVPTGSPLIVLPLDQGAIGLQDA